MAIDKYIHIFGVRIDVVQIPDVCAIMKTWIINKNYGNYIVISNANDAVISTHNAEVKKAVNSSSLTVADGISLVLTARLYGFALKNRVYGPDLMLRFLEIAQAHGYTNFFYGSTQEVLNTLTKNLRKNFPNLKISGSYAPSYRALTEAEDRRIVEDINRISPDVLWIGLGCPKQQLWMYEHKDKLKIPVMVGVGAAFDFLAGTKLQAPAWLRNNGLEWLFRLISEPKRLWRRYLVNGSLFIYYLCRELILSACKINQKHT